MDLSHEWRRSPSSVNTFQLGEKQGEKERKQKGGRRRTEPAARRAQPDTDRGGEARMPYVKPQRLTRCHGSEQGDLQTTLLRMMGSRYPYGVWPWTEQDVTTENQNHIAKDKLVDGGGKRLLVNG